MFFTAALFICITWPITSKKKKKYIVSLFLCIANASSVLYCAAAEEEEKKNRYAALFLDKKKEEGKKKIVAQNDGNQKVDTTHNWSNLTRFGFHAAVAAAAIAFPCLALFSTTRKTTRAQWVLDISRRHEVKPMGCLQLWIKHDEASWCMDGVVVDVEEKKEASWDGEKSEE